MPAYYSVSQPQNVPPVGFEAPCHVYVLMYRLVKLALVNWHVARSQAVVPLLPVLCKRLRLLGTQDVMPFTKGIRLPVQYCKSLTVISCHTCRLHPAQSMLW
jgi:hypothetical protein